jgi:hypothetical protein
MKKKKEAIVATVYIFGREGNWFLNIDNHETGHQTELAITDEQKEELIKEDIPIL